MGFLKTTFFALLLFQAILTINARQNDCSSRLCGQNPFAVRFPFRLQGQQPQSCGYPGFDLSCTGHKRSMALLINLPNLGYFYVRNINYLSQEIQLYDPNKCLPRRLLSFNLSDTPFTAGYSEDYTFLSCPPESVAPTRFTKIDCLSNSTVSVVATLAINLVQPNLDMCSVIATLPVPVSRSHGDDLNDQDIQLTWAVPNCEECEARGGFCGFENSTSDQILCFTDLGTDNSRGLKIVKVIALSIVIPALTCAICISCFACIVGRRAARHLVTIGPPPSPPSIIGLDESTIESYTKVILGESRRLPGPNGATCPICLVDYHPKDIIRCIPQCDHCFHSECIDEWLRLNGSCPVCRNSPSPAG
ncbi:hypothetical protein CASFOL_033643 [Castilleja foliolosa]|uniref:RING-type domain-containing protein n=1 Tax=Castilleja foliolosa TaxID=1961234 RepID=A0ABD3C034_9LAMI